MPREVDPNRRTSFTLINRVKDLDDDEGWREFFERYRWLVLRVASQHGLTDAEAEEVAQEVFARVARNIGVFETGGRPGAFRKWLRQMSTWCALTARRKRQIDVQSLDEPETGKQPSPAEEIANPESPNPHTEVSDRDFHELLLRRLKQLVSARDFDIYQRVTFDGLRPQQVADQMGLSRGAVDTSLSRTRLAARRELARLGEKL
jgi:RNA polymerase sigma factor (sigma-70 family)